MDILNNLEIDLNRHELITFVGAGGKTTTMFRLAEIIKKAGKKVLVSTTTAIYFPASKYYDNIYLIKGDYAEILKKTDKNGISVLGSSINEQGKLKGVNKRLIDSLYESRIFDFILVEGDGSKRKPVKAPAEYEPVIPDCSSKAVGIIGMSSYGRNINEDNVHRPGLFCEVTDSKMQDIINEETLIKLILSEKGLFKNVPLNCKKYLILTQIVSESVRAAAENIIRMAHENERCIKGNLLLNRE